MNQESVRVQKKLRKGDDGVTTSALDSVMRTVHTKATAFEDLQRKSASGALTEERSRFCALARAYAAIVGRQVKVFSEAQNIRACAAAILQRSQHPEDIPAGFEELFVQLSKIKAGNTEWLVPSKGSPKARRRSPRADKRSPKPPRRSAPAVATPSVLVDQSTMDAALAALAAGKSIPAETSRRNGPSAVA